jgi:hypothetical protein
MDIIQRIAQLESEQIGERVHYGQSQKIKDLTVFMDHKTPYGYNVNDGILIEDPETITVVKKIFELAYEGESINKIHKTLKQPFTRIRYILNNPIYAGWERFERGIRKITYIEPIILVKTWNKIQELIYNRRLSNGNKPILIPEEDITEYTYSKEELIIVRRIMNKQSTKLKYLEF